MATEHNEQAQDQTVAQEQDLENTETNENAEEVTVEDLQAQIGKLAESLKLEKARAANAIYESEKVKERLEREADTAKKFALEKFAKGLLESVDNLERAIQAAGEEKTPLLEAVDVANGFNADLHQAVGIDPNAKAGEIGNVLQKGYTLSGRLLRPAMVTVGQ